MTRAVDEAARTYFVHFTSMPLKVDAHFQAHLGYAREAIEGSARAGP